MKTRAHTIILMFVLLITGLGSECGSEARPQAKPFIDGARPVLPTATRPTPSPTKKPVLDSDSGREKAVAGPIQEAVRINDLKAVNCNTQGVNDLCWAYKAVKFSWIDDICITWREWGEPSEPPGVLNVYVIKDGEKILDGQYDEIGDKDGLDCRSHELHNLPPGEYLFLLEQVFPSGRIIEEQWTISTPIPTATPTITPTPKATITPTPPPTVPPIITSDLEAIRQVDPLKIDGYLTEWAGEPSYETPFIIYSAENWDGSDDLRAIWQISWEEKYLLLGVQVVDDKHVQTQAENKLYYGDSLMIFIDAELENDYGPGINQDDFVIDLSPGDFASLPPAADRYQAGNESPGHNIEVNAVQTKQGYSLEAAVPWEDLGLVPVEGLKIGVVLISTDNDTPDTAVQEVVKSNIEGFKFNDPNTWGTLTLE